MRKIFLGILLISLIFSGWYIGSFLKPKETKGGISVTVIVRQYRDGKLINEVIDKKDPFTKNFVALLYLALKSGYGTYSATDISGSSHTLQVDRSSFYTPLAGTGNYIYIGDGSAEFTINDYKLSGTYTQKATTSTPSESTVNPKINYTISASFTLSSAMTIREVGYSRVLRDSGYNYAEFLLMRDVLSTPISAAAGDTVTVTYIIRING